MIFGDILECLNRGSFEAASVTAIMCHAPDRKQDDASSEDSAEKRTPGRPFRTSK
jgi:hypothetical protein